MNVPKLTLEQGTEIDRYLDNRPRVTESLSSSEAKVTSGEKKDE